MGRKGILEKEVEMETRPRAPHWGMKLLCEVVLKEMMWAQARNKIGKGSSNYTKEAVLT